MSHRKCFVAFFVLTLALQPLLAGAATRHFALYDGGRVVELGAKGLPASCDADPDLTVQWAETIVAPGSIPEGMSGTAEVQVEILTSCTQGTLFVDFGAMAGTASSGDFSAGFFNFEFSLVPEEPGPTQQGSFDINIFDDTSPEPDETIILKRLDSFLSEADGTGHPLGPGPDILTIVIPKNDNPPVAADDSATVSSGVDTVINVLANDSDEDGDPLTVRSVGSPSHGEVRINGDQTLTYRSNSGYTGSDSFTYTISDPSGLTDSATVQIDVVEVGSAPVAVDDSATALAGQRIEIDVLANDSDADGDAISVTAVTQPQNGQAAVTDAGLVSYQSRLDFEGDDAFMYTITDATGRTAMAMVSVRVNSSAPTANDDTASTTSGASILIDVLANDTDPNGDPLTVVSVSQPANGQAAIEDNRVAYRSSEDFEGEDSFTYTIRDPDGNTASARVVVRVDAIDEQPIRDALQNLARQNPVAARAVATFVRRCKRADLSPRARERCRRVAEAAANGNGQLIQRVLLAIAGEEATSQAGLAGEIAATQNANVANRMNALRNGASGFSTSGLTLMVDGFPVSLAFAGGMNDAPEAGGLLDNRWSGFLTGSIGGGEKDLGDEGETPFDFDTWEITTGLDYRLNENNFMGLALGYSRFESDFIDPDSGDEDEGGLETEAISLIYYLSSYFSPRFYVDGSLGYSMQDYEQTRIVDLTVIDDGVSVLNSETEADVLIATLGLGYEYNRDRWLFVPSVRVEYQDTSIEDYVEQGDPEFALAFPEQDVTSLQLIASARVARTVSTSRGVLQPYFTLSFNRETDNDGFTILPRLASGPADDLATPLIIDDPDRDFGNFELGTTWIRPNGFSAFAAYQQLFGFDNLDRWVFRIGLRKEF